MDAGVIAAAIFMVGFFFVFSNGERALQEQKQLEEQKQRQQQLTTMSDEIATNVNNYNTNHETLVTMNQTQEQLSTNVTELQTEVIKLRNQLNPRNISQAFPLYPLTAVDAPNDTYSEMTEGTIASLPTRNSSTSTATTTNK